MRPEPAYGERRGHALPEALGKYVPFARLGSGGMADVFLSVARGPVGFNKLAVVKRLRNSDDDSQVEMFLDEARLAARLNHANVVHTYEVGEAQGTYFIAMEYLEGQSLQALLARLNARSEWLSDALVAYIAAQALRGLHFAHELCDFDGTPLGVVHRDVSPHNLHLTYDGEVKLLDFGVAKAKMNAAHTETGMVKGKIRYMAPEQLGDGPVDRRADLFAFGVVLWELLARRSLFQGDAPSVMARVVGEDVAAVREIRPEASPELDAIALKALRRKPDERYATADAMRADLEAFLRGKGEAFDRELARVMNDAFATLRDEIRCRIKAFLDELSADGPGESGGGATVRVGRTSRPALVVRSSDGGDVQMPRVSSGSVADRLRKLRWSWLLLAVAGSASGVVALGRQIRDRPAAAIISVAPAPELASASEPASASAPAPAPASAEPALNASKPVPSAVLHHPPQRPLAPASARPRVNIRVLDDSDSP